MLEGSGTGVATYASALYDALNARDRTPLRITDKGGGRFVRARAPERWLRWCHAVLDRPRRLAHRGHELHARDIFRLAQVHFDRHRSLLRLKAPGPPGIMHWTYPLPIRIEGWINLYTIHDAIPLTHPWLTPIDAPRHLHLLQAIAAGGGHMITVSHAAKADIVSALDCAPDRIGVCPTGLALPAPIDMPLPFGLQRGGYFLAVGSVEPRKNLPRLVEAHRASGTPLPLIVAGPSGWRSDEIEPLLAAAPGVIRMPYPPRDTLMTLMAHARALLFPSLAEGFGLPIVEAMSLGTAVMTSRGGATEEIAGDAALLVDPGNMADISAAIATLGADDDLVDRLTMAGRARAERFAVDRFAARLEEVHHHLLTEYGWTSATGLVKG